jgi:excisionase family DNA binding protein
MSNPPYQLKSLASRLRGRHGALDADELAKLLGVAKVTILRWAKRGKIPSFRISTMVRFDPQAISRWLLEQGVQSLSSPKRAR